MQPILDEFQPEYSFTDREIFTYIWTRPREIFTYIHAAQLNHQTTPLLALAGFSSALDADNINMHQDLPSILLKVILLGIVGALLGWIMYYLYAALMSWTGGWLKGRADTQSLLRVSAYAAIPAIISVILFLPTLFLFRMDLDFSTYTPGWFALILLGLIQIALGLWTLVLLVVGVSVVQKFSIGWAALNVFLPIMVLMIPFLLIIVFADLLFTS